MPRKNDRRSSNRIEPSWSADARAESYGPQGNALILELQRLRQAFDNEGQDPRSGAQRRPARDGGGRNRRPPSRNKSKRKKKGTMERAIDMCLRPFGLRTALPDESFQDIDVLREPPAPLPRRRSPSIVSGDPLAPDAARPKQFLPAPSNLQAPPPGNPARLKLPAKLPVRFEAETPVGRAIIKGSNALSSGVAFLLNPGAHEEDLVADDTLTQRTGRGYERELRTGLRILIVAAVLGGGWMAFVPLAGAVVVQGNLVVQSSVKAIQHPTGGVIAEIKVDNGKHVVAGDLLVRLDPTQTQAGLQATSKQLDEQRAKIARLIAERDGLDQPEFPPELTSRMDEGSVRAVIASELSLFKARQNTTKSQKDLLQGRIGQYTDEIAGMQAQSDSKTKQIDLINSELTGVQELYDKRLVPLTRLTSLQREAARIDGERGQMTSSIAETKSKIGEAQLQIVKTDQDFRSEVVKDLGEAQAKEGELSEKLVAERDQLNRIEMRAPTSGVIHELQVHTIGGVVKAGETIMEIVPDSDELQVEAHVQPKDIDHVHTGQDAFVRFSAFNQRTTPQLTGQVAFVSADTTVDPHSPQGQASAFYTVRVVLSEEERRRLGDVQLIPGMQAEVFMQTGKRTMMSFLMKPFMEQIKRAFVEE
jgi:HlyD family secretion protein